jgi:NADH:ubiquinone oxidoreductase subunit 6 (subunit J)
MDKKRDGRVDAGIGGASRAVLCTAMASFLSTILLPVAVGAVALVLLLGLLNMMRGGSPNRSQKLMRLRVLLQFVAIVITMLAVWAMGR